MNNVRAWMALVLIILLALFTLQNMAIIEVNFFGFSFQMRRIVLIVLCVLTGFVLGKVIRVGKHS